MQFAMSRCCACRACRVGIFASAFSVSASIPTSSIFGSSSQTSLRFIQSEWTNECQNEWMLTIRSLQISKSPFRGPSSPLFAKFIPSVISFQRSVNGNGPGSLASHREGAWGVLKEGSRSSEASTSSSCRKLSSGPAWAGLIPTLRCLHERVQRMLALRLSVLGFK